MGHLHSTSVLVPMYTGDALAFDSLLSPRKKKNVAQQPPSSRPISVVTKRSPIVAVAEHLCKRLPKKKMLVGQWEWVWVGHTGTCTMPTSRICDLTA